MKKSSRIVSTARFADDVCTRAERVRACERARFLYATLCIGAFDRQAEFSGQFRIDGATASVERCAPRRAATKKCLAAIDVRVCV